MMPAHAQNCPRPFCLALAIGAAAGLAIPFMVRGEEPQEEPAATGNAPADDLPRFVINSPFSGKYRSPVPSEEKRLWATSRLWEKAPDLVVERWLTPEPKRDGRFLLIEFWATWCGPCRRVIPKLNEVQRRFANDLVVIGISDETPKTVRAFKDPPIEYAVAVDTQGRMKKELGVVGIPHVIVVEPGGFVVWEGFPLLEGHELTVEVMKSIIEAGRKGGKPADGPAKSQ